MKTSKEMQLKILDRMKENVKRDLPLFDGLYRVIDGSEFILNGLWDNSFKDVEHGIYPETITINGVDIPKPLEKDDIASDPDKVYYIVTHCSNNNYGISGSICIDLGYRFVYNTRQEAITASRKLFGMTEQ